LHISLSRRHTEHQSRPRTPYAGYTTYSNSLGPAGHTSVVPRHRQQHSLRFTSCTASKHFLFKSRSFQLSAWCMLQAPISLPSANPPHSTWRAMLIWPPAFVQRSRIAPHALPAGRGVPPAHHRADVPPAHPEDEAHLLLGSPPPRMAPVPTSTHRKSTEGLTEEMVSPVHPLHPSARLAA